MADQLLALKAQLLDIALTGPKTVLEPEGLADDADGKTVVIGLVVISDASSGYRF